MRERSPRDGSRELWVLGGLMVAATLFALLVGSLSLLRAQPASQEAQSQASGAALPSFEVASIRKHALDAGKGGMLMSIGVLPGDRADGPLPMRQPKP